MLEVLPLLPGTSVGKSPNHHHPFPHPFPPLPRAIPRILPAPRKPFLACWCHPFTYSKRDSYYMYSHESGRGERERERLRLSFLLNLQRIFVYDNFLTRLVTFQQITNSNARTKASQPQANIGKTLLSYLLPCHVHYNTVYST